MSVDDDMLTALVYEAYSTVKSRRLTSSMRGSRGGAGGLDPPPLENRFPLKY